MNGDYAVSKNSLVNKTETLQERLLKAALDASAINWLWVQRTWVCGYYPDLYEPTSRMCVEADGEYHKSAKRTIADRLRDSTLAENGVHTIRFTNTQIETNIARCVEHVERVFHERLRVLMACDVYEPHDVGARRAVIARATAADPFARQ